MVQHRSGTMTREYRRTAIVVLFAAAALLGPADSGLRLLGLHAPYFAMSGEAMARVARNGAVARHAPHHRMAHRPAHPIARPPVRPIHRPVHPIARPPIARPPIIVAPIRPLPGVRPW